MIEQNTDAWFAQRIGLVTASRLNDVMATIKSGEASTRRNYKAQLVAERLTGTKAESYTNAAMQWGTDNEPIARAMYEVKTGRDVEQVGFIRHPSIEWSGASPDGFVDDGLIEIKCPNTATHIDYILGGVAPTEYLNQMLWQMECTGRNWCDFASYDPRMPEDMQLFIVRVKRDDEKIAELRDGIVKFLCEVDAVMVNLNDYRGRIAK